MMDFAGSTTKKYLLILVAFAVLSVLSSIIWYIFWMLSFLITGYGSIAVFVIGFYLLIGKVCRFLVFPGAHWYWRRSLESGFCTELASALYRDIGVLRIGLDVMLGNSSDFEQKDFYDRSNVLIYCKKRVNNTIHSLEVLQRDNTITYHQKNLLVQLTALKSSFKLCKIQAQQIKPCTLWQFITSFDESLWVASSLEDYPNNTSANHARDLCIQVQTLLRGSFVGGSMLNRLQTWMNDTTLGTFDYMRADLVRQLGWEQVWVETADSRLDWMWIPSNTADSNSPTMIFCNPNAAYYEYLYYQIEWIRYYTSSGINVFLWNYRGYGRSVGSLSVGGLKADTSAIFNYIKTKRQSQRIGVHGESLGGAVATYMARHHEVCFLFADRTFATLGDAAYHMIGRAGRFLLHLVQEDFENADDFYYAQCFKLLSSDPLDHAIHDLASLKSGVAARSLMSCSQDMTKFQYVLTAHEANQTHLAIQRLMEVILHAIKLDDEKDRNGGSTASGSIQAELSSLISSNYKIDEYTPLASDNEIDDETVVNILFALCNILDELDAGGKPLSYLVDTDKADSISALSSWIAVLEVYGCVGKAQSATDQRKMAVAKLTKQLQDLDKLIKDSTLLAKPMMVQICKDMTQVQHALTKILEHLSNAQNSPKPEEYGYLIPLQCGHNGVYNANERLQYGQYLEKANFIKQ